MWQNRGQVVRTAPTGKTMMMMIIRVFHVVIMLRLMQRLVFRLDPERSPRTREGSRPDVAAVAGRKHQRRRFRTITSSEQR